MSQTLQTPQVDAYLAAQTVPPNDLTPDPKYHNLRMVTPIGRFAHIHVDRPHIIKQQDGTPGRPKYNATLLMSPHVLGDLYKAILLVADAEWPAIERADPQTGQRMTVKGSALLGTDQNLGGIHYPLRNGDENYIKDPAKFDLWRGLWFINCGMDPVTKSGVQVRPVCLDEQGNECDPAKFYPGCYGRMNVTVAPFTNSGKKGVTFYLNAVQFARYGERMATGFDATAAAKNSFASAGALPVSEPMPMPGYAPPPGFGPNAMTPGSIPPGFAPPPGATMVQGFAPVPIQSPMIMQPQQQPIAGNPQWQQQPVVPPQQWPGQPTPLPQQPYVQPALHAQPQGFIPPQNPIVPGQPQQAQPWQPAVPGAGPRPPGA